MNKFIFLGFVLFLSLVCQLSLADNTATCTDKNGSPGRCVFFGDCPKINQYFSERFDERQPPNFDDYRCSPHKVGHVCCVEEKKSEGIKLLESLNCGDYDYHPFERKLSPNTRPFMALLNFETENKEQKFLCSGALISNRYVLTAAHCFNEYNLTSVKLGAYTAGPVKRPASRRKYVAPAENVDIEKVIVHEEYLNNNPQDNDIALVKLARDVTFRKGIAPICLPWNDTTQAEQKSVIYYNTAGWSSSSYLTETVASPKNESDCERSLRRYLSESQFCAGNRGLENCDLDDGGPLTHTIEIRRKKRRYQYGIYSFGVEECGDNYPAVYTNVASYINWIAEKIVL